MNNKTLKIIAIIIISILASISLMSNVYAESTYMCKIDFGTIKPSNPTPGQEITIAPSLTEINEAVAMVQFVIEYDDTLFDISSEEGTDVWDLKKEGTTYFASTKNGEATTSTGNFCTVKLKAKADASNKTTTIKITHIAAVGDDGIPADFPDTAPVEIKIVDSQYVNPPADTNNEPTSTVQNNNNNNNNANNNNNKQSNAQNSEKPATSSDVDNNKIVVVNGNTGNNNSSKNGDVSTATKNLPKTGVKTISILTIAIAMITMIISYRAYRKYKNI